MFPKYNALEIVLNPEDIKQPEEQTQPQSAAVMRRQSSANGCPLQWGRQWACRCRTPWQRGQLCVQKVV